MEQKLTIAEQIFGLVEKVTGFLDKFGIVKMFKTIFAVVVMYWLIVLAFNPSKIFEVYERYKDKIHSEKVAIVEKNNTIIHTELENLRYKCNADRVVLLSYHNTKESLTGMPYIYLTAINESISYDVSPVAEGYESLKTTLYPFISYISRNEFFCGDIEDLRKIDKALAYRMEGNDVKHLAVLNIESDLPIGVLVVTFAHPLEDTHNCEEIEKLIRKTSTKIGILLTEARR